MPCSTAYSLDESSSQFRLAWDLDASYEAHRNITPTHVYIAGYIEDFAFVTTTSG